MLLLWDEGNASKICVREAETVAVMTTSNSTGCMSRDPRDKV